MFGRHQQYTILPTIFKKDLDNVNQSSFQLFKIAKATHVQTFFFTIWDSAWTINNIHKGNIDS